MHDLQGSKCPRYSIWYKQFVTNLQSIMENFELWRFVTFPKSENLEWSDFISAVSCLYNWLVSPEGFCRRSAQKVIFVTWLYFVIVLFCHVIVLSLLWTHGDLTWPFRWPAGGTPSNAVSKCAERLLAHCSTRGRKKSRFIYSWSIKLQKNSNDTDRLLYIVERQKRLFVSFEKKSQALRTVLNAAFLKNMHSLSQYFICEGHGNVFIVFILEHGIQLKLPDLHNFQLWSKNLKLK